MMKRLFPVLVLLLSLIASLDSIAQQRNGKVEEHYPNGQLRYEYKLKKGEKHGTHSAWYENGQLQTMVTYRKGQYHGKLTAWHQDGRLHKEEEYYEGKLNGTITHYYADGTLKFVGTYEMDVLKYYRQYLPDGTLDREEQL